MSKRRQHCLRCLRPQRTCLCDLVQNIDNDIAIHLLQHPKEAHHPKGSARLLQLSLAKIETWQGEQFEQLETQLNNDRYREVLLYPHTEPQASDSGQACIDPQRPLRLWVIDATWRKAYKILQLNPALLSLERMSPSAMSDHYSIRKAPKPGQLSTLEACCHALAELEQAPTKYQPLLEAFASFNQRWQAFSAAKPER